MICLVQRLPERIVEKAVKGMLPSGRIGRHLFTHLKVLLPPLSLCLTGRAIRPFPFTHQEATALPGSLLSGLVQPQLR